jgi:hypothetical protein
MKLSKPLEAVTERDLDLLFVEEAHSSDDFVQLLANAAFGKGSRVASTIGAWHSFTDANFGETDVLVMFFDDANRKCAILLENKVDAPAQPEQGARYAKRAQAGVVSGDWDDARTAMIAPRKYLEASHDASAYDGTIAYEDLVKWFAERDGRRAQYRSSVLEQAIDQSRRGYSPEVDEDVTRFSHEYWMCASREFPELGVAEPGPRPAGSRWLGCRPQGMPQDRYIWHKMNLGRVDLEIKGAAAAVDGMRETCKDLMSTDTEIVKAGKAAAVRIQVPILDPFAEFAEQIDSARAGMRAAYRLAYLSQAIRSA